MRKQTLLILIVIIAGIAVVLAVTEFPGQRAKPADVADEFSGPITQQEEARYGQLSPQETLARFPEGFPVELEGVLSSYQSIPAHTKQRQFTLEYETQKTLTENLSDFESFLNVAGFEILNSSDSTELAFFYAVRDNTELAVSLWTNPLGNLTVLANFTVKE